MPKIDTLVCDTCNVPVAKFDDVSHGFRPTRAGCVEVLLDGIDHEKRRDYCFVHAVDAVRHHISGSEHPYR